MRYQLPYTSHSSGAMHLCYTVLLLYLDQKLANLIYLYVFVAFF